MKRLLIIFFAVSLVAQPPTSAVISTDGSGNGSHITLGTGVGAALALNASQSGGVCVVGTAPCVGVPISNPTAPVITTAGTAGTTTWCYKVVAVDTWGNATAASLAGCITSLGNATLTGSNYNIVTWSSVTGAVGYLIYRTTVGSSPASLGLIYAGASPIHDTGIVGDTTTAPTVNATGITTPYLDFTNPVFGGSCNGVDNFDNSPAIRLAYASGMASGKPVFIPPSASGCFINSTLDFKSTTKFTMFGSIRGSYPQVATSFENSSALVWDASTFSFTDLNDVMYFSAGTGPGGGVNLHDFQIDNPGQVSATGNDAVLRLDTTGNTVDNILVQHGTGLKGVEITGSANYFYNVVASLNNLNLYMNASCANTIINSFFTNALNANSDPTQGYEMQAFGGVGTVQEACVNTFVNTRFDESGTTISLGTYDIWNFLGGSFFSGNMHYALRLLGIGGQSGGQVNITGTYLGPYDSTSAVCSGASCGGLENTNATNARVNLDGATLASLNHSGSLYNQPISVQSGGTGTNITLHNVTLNGTPALQTSTTVIGNQFQKLITLSIGAGTYTFPITTLQVQPQCLFYDTTTPANAVIPTYTAATSVTLAGVGSDVIYAVCTSTY